MAKQNLLAECDSILAKEATIDHQYEYDQRQEEGGFFCFTLQTIVRSARTSDLSKSLNLRKFSSLNICIPVQRSPEILINLELCDLKNY